MQLSKNTRTRLVWVDGKKVRAHRHIMAQHLGRTLSADEEVHHRDHNPLNNNIENLAVLSRAEHIALHAEEKRQYPSEKNCVECGALFTVNPRKRSRHKTCSRDCAQAVRVRGMLKARGLR